MNYIAGCINTSQEMKKVYVQLLPYITIMWIIVIATIRHQCHSWPSERLLQMSMGWKPKLKVSVVSGDMYMKDLDMLKHHEQLILIYQDQTSHLSGTSLRNVTSIYMSAIRLVYLRTRWKSSRKLRYMTLSMWKYIWVRKVYQPN